MCMYSTVFSFLLTALEQDKAKASVWFWNRESQQVTHSLGVEQRWHEQCEMVQSLTVESLPGKLSDFLGGDSGKETLTPSIRQA